MKKLLIFFSSILFLLQCSESIIDPVLEPGKRDYLWSSDTIETFNGLHRLWGSSPIDLWAITSGEINKNIYHYDGFQWKTGEYVLPNSSGPSAIYGFSPYNIFIGGHRGLIWHFDGNAWSEIAALTKDGHSDIVFNNIWGNSSNDLYTFGAYGDDQKFYNNSVIAHFNGSTWKVLNTNGLKGIVASLFKNKSDNVYAQVIKWSNTYDSTFIYEYKNETFKKLYVTVWSGTWAGISLINEEVYFILKKEIALRKKQKFEMILDLNDYNFYQKIWGRNSKDIFLLMKDGLAHYNGTDIEYLFYFDKPRTQIYGAALFNEEVFFLVYESPTGLSLIYHGTLTN